MFLKIIKKVGSFFKKSIPFLLLFVLIVFIFSSGVLVGCKSLKVIQVEGQPQSCNDMYTTMDYNLKRKVQDNTMVTMWMTECIKCRNEINQKRNESDCKNWIFGNDEIDKKNYEKYNSYLECVK